MTIRGKGPAPKDPSKRARTNNDPIPLRVINSDPAPQPPLPEVMPDGEDWPAQTRVWWQMWRDDPLSAEFRATDWSDLMDCAVVHGLFWRGDAKQAAELRLRTAKFGATQEDRARLRITFAAADAADKKRAKPMSSVEDRYGKFTG